ncbi:hypothetical protein MMC10_000218 [Thelotrema lepadinum]|nr:hypothetical protein [Thelotrema lepadinum]
MIIRPDMRKDRRDSKVLFIHELLARDREKAIPSGKASKELLQKLNEEHWANRPLTVIKESRYGFEKSGHFKILLEMLDMTYTGSLVPAESQSEGVCRFNEWLPVSHYLVSRLRVVDDGVVIGANRQMAMHDPSLDPIASASI